MKNIQKAVLAVLGAVVVTVHELLAQGSWTLPKTLLVLLALFGAYTVYVVPNLPQGNGVGTFSKWCVALAVAGIETTIPLLDDRVVTSSEWLVIAMAVLTAAGVPLLKGPTPAVLNADGSHRITGLS
ncbi:hypothetical protein AB0425_17620 [Actinosynnema sp. NPDC051121]